MKTKTQIILGVLTMLIVFTFHDNIFCQQAELGIKYTNSYPIMKPNYLSLFTQKKPIPSTLETSSSSFIQYDALRFFMTNSSNKNMTLGLYKKEDLAFFCRLEVRMENTAKLPVKFRLGDVQYVDYLEGKYEAWRYNY